MAKIKIETEIQKDPQKRISRHIYGHFAEHLGRCFYDGFWVGDDSSIPNTRGFRNDIVEALKKLEIPNLRWPGGCFADEYHWRNGIGPKERRAKTINTHWGGVIENNHVGTHEFLDLCEQLECEPYICGNVGSGTIQEMAEWIEYLTFDDESTLSLLRRKNGRKNPWKIKYWGVGNENWGCGGNMTAEHYSDLFFRYSTFCKNFSDNKLYKIACGPTSGPPMSWITHWIEVLMIRAGLFISLIEDIYDAPIHGISLHHYTSAGLIKKGSATEFKEQDWLKIMRNALKMEDLLMNMSRVMDKYDPRKKIGIIVDEWGTWHEVEPDTNPGFLFQQNTMRDAMVASLTLDLFNRYCDRVHMANLAQTVNVLQAPILTEGDKMITTPTYHVFEMYKVHQDAFLIPMKIESEVYKRKTPAIHGSASIDENDKIHLSLCNINPNEGINVELELSEVDLKEKQISARILQGKQMNDRNTFDSPENVKPTAFPSSYFNIEANKLNFKIPFMSIIVITIEK